jgi:predicted regulator of Ras-like GTPase activity (Roadblock/LC7/MglB family)
MATVAELDWLLNGFVQRTTGVRHTVAVSGDGLLITASRELAPERAEQIAAVVAGVVSLAQAVAHTVDRGPVLRSIVQMRKSLMFVMALGDGRNLASLAAITMPTVDVGQVAFEMTALVSQVGPILTPQVRSVDFPFVA